MTHSDIVIEHVRDKKGRAAFVDVGNAFSARVPNSVPQLRGEQIELITRGKNPFFGHARAQLFIAKVNGKPVGRISAHIDELALQVPKEQGFGPGTGMFGYFDADSEAVAHALLAEAEKWLLSEEMTRVLGPISMSIWEEPGLLVRGQDHPPMIMMGHHPAHYRGWIESYGFTTAKTLLTYDLPVDREFPPLIQRIVKSGERNSRITVRQVVKKRWDSEAAIILSILNDAWSGNWGFVPFTADEIAYAGKKLRPIIFEPLNMIAELDGEPVAFLLTFPDINQVLAKINGKLFPFGWFHMLRWLHFPKGSGMRVPLMGVKKELHNSRMASQLAFMMIDQIRRTADELYESKRGEVGWILDDNKGMVAIADAINSKINREYIVFGKDLI
ncbi:MAG: N-acetyltransferase [Altererythrobacter sp. XM-24bin4]|uniref:N-acetyltransferase n=1 Tax=uncultured Altererythrobacter sp. TaxID=500840 RepID=UPI000D7A9B68|nr:N-acetyltransferase [uncultured Altererythrobacter sp.]PWL24864.1 MAG: N-acetyltransferase [Altererythrobacter sp. XM-24bin4]